MGNETPIAKEAPKAGGGSKRVSILTILRGPIISTPNQTQSTLIEEKSCEKAAAGKDDERELKAKLRSEVQRMAQDASNQAPGRATRATRMAQRDIPATKGN